MAPQTNEVDANASDGGKERPWLYPRNLRLRHVHRVILRNITTSSEDRFNFRRRSTDDEVLPETLHSPEKLLALDESEELVRRSQSSVDIRRGNSTSFGVRTTSPEPAIVVGSPESRRSRPKNRLPGLRRRSTLEWAHASPQQRQSRLQQLVASKLVAVFYSLHIDGVHSPVYVSELATDTINPDFSQIDWASCGPYITRSDSVVIKIWVKKSDDSEFGLLSLNSLYLHDLQYLGKTLTQYRHTLPRNCILLELTDGFYTTWRDIASDSQQTWSSLASTGTTSNTTSSIKTRGKPGTSSFDALLRLSKLDDSIQDALTLRQKLKVDLDKTIATNHAALSDADRLLQAKDFLKTIEYAQMRVRKQTQTLRKTRDNAKESLFRKRELLERGRQQHAAGSDEDGHEAGSNISSTDTNNGNDTKVERQVDVVRQRRRVCETLQKIFPIVPIPNRPLSFTICGLHLPNSEDLEGGAAAVEEIAGALGCVTQVLQLLSLYLVHPLPYPVYPRSSTSTISDPISVMGADMSGKSAMNSAFSPSKQGQKLDPASRTFPLFPRGVTRYRFEYGVFLLNKNIELLLSNIFRVRVLDIRQTLPNLLYVLYCATAGEGELPARKAGGIRGLLRTGRASFSKAKPSKGIDTADGHDDGNDEDEIPIQSFRVGTHGGHKRMSRLLGRDSSVERMERALCEDC